jgi:hypothetical protein
MLMLLAQFGPSSATWRGQVGVPGTTVLYSVPSLKPQPPYFERTGARILLLGVSGEVAT